jgi:FMN phosphatase YigB (HAD superfamily)
MQKRPILICDWDCTLAEPISRDFYSLHRIATKKAVSTQFQLNDSQVEELYSVLSAEGIRIEKLFSSENLVSRFNLTSNGLNRFDIIKDALEDIDPSEWFKPDAELVEELRLLKPHMKIIVLSNSPIGIIRNIGEIIGFDMDNDFDAYYTMTAETGSPKFVNPTAAFDQIIAEQQPVIAQSWSIGDSPKIDLDPALALGMNAAFVDNLDRHDSAEPYEFKGHTIPTLQRIRRHFIR